MKAKKDRSLSQSSVGLCRKCKLLSESAAALSSEASSSASSLNKLAARIQTLFRLKKDIEQEARQLGEANTKTRDPDAGELLLNTSKHLHETRRYFESAIRKIETLLEETEEDLASLRRAKRAVESYGTTLQEDSG